MELKVKILVYPTIVILFHLNLHRKTPANHQRYSTPINKGVEAIFITIVAKKPNFTTSQDDLELE
jgi:hypothetical protein